jgi:hypothetical protein
MQLCCFSRYAVFILLLLFLTPLWALDPLFSARVTTGFTNYKRQATYTIFVPGLSPSQIKQSYSDTLPLFGIGGTIILDRLYFDLAYQKAFDGKDNTNPNPTNPIFNVDLDFAVKNRFNLDSTVLTGGYSFDNNLTLLLGYRYARTNLDFISTTQARDPLTGIDLFQSRGRTEYRNEFKGPFVGASYVLPVTERGRLSFSLALGRFSGNSKEKVSVDGISLQGRSYNLGETTGLSYGVRWTSILSAKWLYNIGLDAYRYEFKGDKPTPGQYKGTVFGDSVEQEISLRFNLSYRF